MLNNCSIMGRLTDTPILKTTADGLSVCSFQLATTGRRKDADGKYIASYISCVAWKSDAEFLCRNFQKGNMIIVTGELTTKQYIDKNGTNIKITELIARNIEYSGEKAAPQA